MSETFAGGAEGVAISAALRVDESEAIEKETRLLASLGGLNSLLIAFSGGADSAYLAWAAAATLGDRALAVTALSASYSAHDRGVAETFVRNHGIRHEWIETREIENPLYIANNADRCYHCKDELFTKLDSIARERRFAAVAYGVNSDDTRDFRPGHRAAFEHKVIAPLLDAGLRKSEIRFLSRRAGLETWDRPASPCLSSRVPYGTAVTPELLAKIESAETVLRELGFWQFRVRAHAETARVEIAQDELPRALEAEIADRIDAGIKRAGFFYVAIDLEGYRQGSLNAALQQK
jgi:pyridinium-3,5-biscarboxylic acid mononucleotide sulfurtransferase